MQLNWHDYRYYPYERELAVREAAALLGHGAVRETNTGLELSRAFDPTLASRLTYFSGYLNGHGLEPTIQARLEAAARWGNRQATRYSAHGLHEYKGKFNPQVAKALLNILGVKDKDRVLDPFCGSGTTLVEASQLGAIGYGTDINPLAVYLANTKLQMLGTPACDQRAILRKIALKVHGVEKWHCCLPNDERTVYLRSWFDESILLTIERLRNIIAEAASELSSVFFAIASNLLRDYSLQDPNDLRIRRRKSSLPHTPLYEAFLSACDNSIRRIEAAQAVLGVRSTKSKAVLCDVSDLVNKGRLKHFDAAITSPPYAMALPYIDTQRLSLVWLGLLRPGTIAELEAKLIGSREIRGKARRALVADMQANTAGLPTSEAEFCCKLQRALAGDDGFRRQAVPSLLYRYFASMMNSLRSVRSTMKSNATFALVVGHNHTTLGGQRIDINTPQHLANLANACGWRVDELLPLQTYRRYGLHASNAVEAETLLFLRNG